MKPVNSTKAPKHEPAVNPPDSPERRAALEKLAVLSAWTVPTTLMLLRSKRASADSFTEEPPPEPI